MAQPDYTYLAVRRQLEGMRATAYEVGIRDRQAGKMLPRFWKKEDVLKAIPWLKRQNSQDCDVYIRPQGSQGLILLDDLTHGALERMKTDGLHPAAIIETSPLNFQAWVRISLQPIAEDLATATAQYLAECFAADPNSADWRHYGRLAGFTNRKPEHLGGSGKAPFVKAHACNGKLAHNAPQLLDKCCQILERKKVANNLQHPPQASKNAIAATSVSVPCQTSEDPQHFYQRYLKALRNEFGAALDESRADWMIAKRMASLGYERDAIEQAIYTLSPDLDTRKQGHIDDYVRRTLTNVWAHPEVQKAREALIALKAQERL